MLCITDGTAQDFLDPTRPVNFKIYAGWPAGRPVSDRPGRPVFVEGFCSLFHASNEKFSKGGGVIGKVLNLWLRTRVSEKKRKKILPVLQK